MYEWALEDNLYVERARMQEQRRTVEKIARIAGNRLEPARLMKPENLGLKGWTRSFLEERMQKTE